MKNSFQAHVKWSPRGYSRLGRPPRPVVGSEGAFHHEVACLGSKSHRFLLFKYLFVRALRVGRVHFLKECCQPVSNWIVCTWRNRRGEFLHKSGKVDKI